MEAFRRRYPMDDSAWDYLTTQPGIVQAKLINDFQPKSSKGNGADFSALVQSFTTSVAKRYRDNSDGFAKGFVRKRFDEEADEENQEAEPQEGQTTAGDPIHALEKTLREIPKSHLEFAYSMSCVLPQEPIGPIEKCLDDV